MNRLTLVEQVHVRTWLDGKYARRPESHYLDFVIDDIPLRRRAPEAGDLVTELNRAWLSEAPESVEVLLGRRPHPDLDPGRIALLVCGSCGDLDCGALTALLTMSDTEVRWSDWRWVAHDGEHPIAPDLGDFTFHRARYEDVLLGVVPRLAQMPYDELAHEGKRFLWPWQWGWKLR